MAGGFRLERLGNGGNAGIVVVDELPDAPAASGNHLLIRRSNDDVQRLVRYVEIFGGKGHDTFSYLDEMEFDFGSGYVFSPDNVNTLWTGAGDPYVPYARPEALTDQLKGGADLSSVAAETPLSGNVDSVAYIRSTFPEPMPLVGVKITPNAYAAGTVEMKGHYVNAVYDDLSKLVLAEDHTFQVTFQMGSAAALEMALPLASSRPTSMFFSNGSLPYEPLGFFQGEF